MTPNYRAFVNTLAAGFTFLFAGAPARAAVSVLSPHLAPDTSLVYLVTNASRGKLQASIRKGVIYLGADNGNFPSALVGKSVGSSANIAHTFPTSSSLAGNVGEISATSDMDIGDLYINSDSSTSGDPDAVISVTLLTDITFGDGNDHIHYTISPTGPSSGTCPAITLDSSIQTSNSIDFSVSGNVTRYVYAKGIYKNLYGSDPANADYSTSALISQALSSGKTPIQYIRYDCTYDMMGTSCMRNGGVSTCVL